jgi:hypothetical protein
MFENIMKRLEKMGFERNVVIFLAGTIIFCAVAGFIAHSVEKEISTEPSIVLYNTKIIDKGVMSDREYTYFSIITSLQRPFNSVLVEVVQIPNQASDNFTNLKVGACYNITATLNSQIKHIEEAECL